MAEPALKIATDFVRVAVADFDMSWSPSVESALAAGGLDLTDLHNALTFCEVTRSNKTEAEGVFLEVVGETTENVELRILVWVNTDRSLYRVEEVS